MDNEKKVYDFMKNVGEPMRQKDVVEATGIDKKDVCNIISKLKKEEKVFSPKRCFIQAK